MQRHLDSQKDRRRAGSSLLERPNDTPPRGRGPPDRGKHRHHRDEESEPEIVAGRERPVDSAGETASCGRAAGWGILRALDRRKARGAGEDRPAAVRRNGVLPGAPGLAGRGA